MNFTYIGFQWELSKRRSENNFLKGSRKVSISSTLTWYCRKGVPKSLVFNLAHDIYLLSFPGCCWISSRRYFLAKSMNPFMGRLGFSGSLAVFLAGDMGGDITEPEAVEALTEGRRLAIPCRRLRPPNPESGRRPPGENWSDKSWLE